MSVRTLSLVAAPGGHSGVACARPVVLGFLRSVFPLLREPERERELAYSVLCRMLAHPSMTHPSRLRSLRSFRLSPALFATMNRSDSSLPLRPRYYPWAAGSGASCRLGTGAYDVSLGHAHRSSHHPGANHATGSCAGLRLSQGGSPARNAESRSQMFQAGVWFQSFTGWPRGSGYLHLREVRQLHRFSRRDSNPLAMCAARRTRVSIFMETSSESPVSI